MNWPVGSQYASKTGHGSLLGMAEDIILCVENKKQKIGVIALVKKSKRVEMREYIVRRRQNPPSLKMTNSMKTVLQYLKTHPGAKRGEIYREMESTICQSSLGLALKTLINYEQIEANGRTTGRRFYIAGSKP